MLILHSNEWHSYDHNQNHHQIVFLCSFPYFFNMLWCMTITTQMTFTITMITNYIFILFVIIFIFSFPFYTLLFHFWFENFFMIMSTTMTSSTTPTTTTIKGTTMTMKIWIRDNAAFTSRNDFSLNTSLFCSTTKDMK